MTEIDKTALQTGKARSVELTDIDPEVEIDLIEKEISQDKDIMDEVSFYRQIKFTKSDSERLTKEALGQDAFKRSDDPDSPEIKEKEYQEAEKLAPWLQKIWKKIEKERIRARFQLNSIIRDKDVIGLEESKIKELSDAERYLEEKIGVLDGIQIAIIEEKSPNEIIKMIDSVIAEYDGENHKDSVNTLEKFKNQINKNTKKNNIDKNMTPEESPIIDPELKINEDENNRIKDGGIEQEESLQEVVERSESEIAHVQNSIKAETENSKMDVEQKSETIEDPLVKNQVLADAQKSSSETVQAVGSAADAVKKETNEVIKAQAPETETKNPELSLKKDQLEKELSDIKINLNVFEKGKKEEREKGKSEELDTLVNHMIRRGVAKKSKNTESKGLRNYLEKGLKDRQIALNRARYLCNQSKSPDEFYQKLQDEIDIIKINRQKELDEVIAKDIDENKKKEERKMINNKYDFRQGAYLNYLPLKIKSEPTGEPLEPKAVESKIDAKPADVQPDSQPNRNERDEIAAAYDQRIENLRLGADEARQAGKEDRAKELEKYAREVENEKKWRLRNADGKDRGRGEDKDIKPQVQNKDVQASKDKAAEPKNFDQEWQNLREQIKQAEKEGKGEEVKRLEQEIYKLEQKKRDEKALAQERKNEARKKSQMVEIEQRIANLRLEIAEAEKANNEDEVLKLEDALRGAQMEKSNAEGKSVRMKDNKINVSKTKAAQGEAIKEPSQNPTELDSDVAETNHKTNGPVYGKESTPEDAQEKAERIKNGKKAEGKKEEPATAETMASKEKTAEEILREKNIEVYGGAEKLNQIFEDYKRLNELEDRGAYYEKHPLFPEWDALRVKIANINLEIIAKDRTVDLYKIQNKDEAIREYFNTKLEESLETFQKDIEKASPNELAIRAATLIKFRNELKNCDWQEKDKYRNTSWKEYLEIIKVLEQKIDILNKMLPKKESASPEAALEDMSINDFKKIEKEPEYKGGYPAVIEGEKLRTEMTAEQTARVEKILKDFDLTAEDAEKIEGFKDLSYGQRLLALQNLRQLTLRDVRIGAVKTQKEEAAQTQGFWKRMWKGIKKRYDIAKHEKSIANDLNKEDYAATLAQLARGMKELKTDVVEKNGQLEFQYVSGLENLTPEQAARVQRFNEVASELSKLPMEWTADNSKKGFFRQMMDKAGLGQAWSPDDPTRSQHRQTGELNAEFQSLKQEVVRIIKQQKDSDLKKAGVEKFDDLETQSHATAQMLQIENLLRYNRAMNINPDAEKALLEIKSAPLWKRALNNIATEKGIYFVAGFAARSVSISLLGTAGIIGGAAGMGGYMGYKRGKETLRENDALAQHKDFEETKKKRIEKFERAKQGKAGQAGEAEKTEKRIEDANVLARNLNNFVEYIKEEDDPKRRMDLSRRLRDRVKFVKDALDQGRINFGATGERAANLYELTDKLNNAVNCVEIYHPSTRHEADQWSEANQSEVMEKLNQYLAESKIELDAERRKYLVKQLAKGAMYGAGFASAGMIARELFSHLDPHLFNAQGETDLGVRWISGSGSGKPLVGGIVGKYMHGEPGGRSGGSIPPHEAGMPAGSGSGKSAYDAFMAHKPKDYDMFPWQKSTESIQEIPMGQGSFAERFLRAVGMHEGSPAKPDLQKIVADYSEYFRGHPDLLKNNNSSLEFLNHLKSDLQNTGLNSDAAENIAKGFGVEMGKMGTGIYPEGEMVPGIETVGTSGGSSAAAKTIESIIDAKQGAVSSAVETASGKLDSVWKMIDHQLDQKGVFKGLTGTPEEIAAKKTYMIDYFKDIVAKSPKEFGLKDVDNLQIGQKVDLSKLFDNPSRFGEIIRDTNVLPADKLASIFEHDQTIAEFHRLHPDIPISSENVDQILGGHGEALLKKAVAQAAEHSSASAAPSTVDAAPIEIDKEFFKSRVAPEPWDSRLINNPHEYQSVFADDNFDYHIFAADKMSHERTNDLLNGIFDPVGKHGIESALFKGVKNEIANNFINKDLSNDSNVLDLTVREISKYQKLQEAMNKIITENHVFPKINETVVNFIERAEKGIALHEMREALNGKI